ncbi:MAG: CHASE2 domain-containing protein [Pirellulales bacterium]
MSLRFQVMCQQVGRAIQGVWTSTVRGVRYGCQLVYRFLVWARILPRDPHLPLHRYVIKHLPVMLIVFLITLAAEKMGWFRGLETYGLDVLLRLNERPSGAPIFLVLIDDQDYSTLFNSTSPLAADQLRDLLQDVARAQPKLIGVDIDTAHHSYASIQDWPVAIWARDARPAVSEVGDELDGDQRENASHTTGDAHETDGAEDGARHGHDGHELIPVLRGQVLGRGVQEGVEYGARSDVQLVSRTSPSSGLPLFPTDADGVIRRYQRVFFSTGFISGQRDEAYVDSLSWAITRDYCGTDVAANSDPAISTRLRSDLNLPEEKLTEAIGLNFAFDRYRLPRIHARDLKRAARQEYWSQRSPLRGAIVLVGGTYAAARDSYPTPVGNRYGVELLAHAIETDLTGGGIREFNHRLAQVLDIGVGLSFLFLTWRFPGRAAFHISLASIALLSLGASWFAFRTLAYWFNFIPMLCGQLLELEWERGKELAELRHEVETLRAGHNIGH